MHSMVLAKHDLFFNIRKSGNQEFAGVFSCFPDSNEAWPTAGFRFKNGVKLGRKYSFRRVHRSCAGNQWL